MAAALPTVTSAPLLLHSIVCPFVHRVTLALSHKQQKLSPVLNRSDEPSTTVREVEIDLLNKPEWLTRYSPLGKVPAVTYKEGDKEHVLYESLALIHWVDEFYDGPALLPASPAERALARIIIGRYDSSFVPAWYGALKATNRDQIAEALPKMHTELSWLEQHMDPTGPFFLGTKPTLVDTAVAPWLLRLGVIKHWRGVDLLAKHKRAAAYVDAYRQQPEVQATFRSLAGTVGWEGWEAAAFVSYGKYAGGVKADYADVDAAL